jgi:uncharacterized protein (TIGR03435 family)
MNQTAKTVLTSVAVALAVAALVAVKMIWFPSIKDKWFENAQQLKQAPGKLIVLRPTHFPHAQTNDLIYVPFQRGRKLAGRNVTLQQLISIAYAYNEGRIYIPRGAPAQNFDVLVTVPLYTARDRLKQLIRSKTGYLAATETRNADVLALKVQNPNSPNMTLSGAHEKETQNFKNGKLYLTHLKLQDITPALERFMQTPVVDETGMSNNFYDFTLDWKQGMDPSRLSQDDFEQIVQGWGLKLEPDTEPVEMLVAKKQ